MLLVWTYERPPDVSCYPPERVQLRQVARHTSMHLSSHRFLYRAVDAKTQG